MSTNLWRRRHALIKIYEGRTHKKLYSGGITRSLLRDRYIEEDGEHYRITQAGREQLKLGVGSKKKMTKCPNCLDLEKSWPQEVDVMVGDTVIRETRGDLECAFLSGKFASKNWCCGTMAKLRWIAEEHKLLLFDYDRQQSYAVIPFDLDVADDEDAAEFGSICLTWYKNRGQTENAVVLWEEGERDPALTLEIATKVIAQYAGSKPNAAA